MQRPKTSSETSKTLKYSPHTSLQSSYLSSLQPIRRTESPATALSPIHRPASASFAKKNMRNSKPKPLSPVNLPKPLAVKSVGKSKAKPLSPLAKPSEISSKGNDENISSVKVNIVSPKKVKPVNNEEENYRLMFEKSEQNLKEKDLVIAKLSARLKDNESEIASLKKQLSTKEELVKSLQEQMTAHVEEAKRQKEEIIQSNTLKQEEKDSKINELELEISSISEQQRIATVSKISNNIIYYFLIY